LHVFYNILLWVGVVVAITFAALIFITAKGDAMSGGTGVRTTFKGKAGYDDMISRMTLGLGIAFMALMLILDAMSSHLFRS
jgi:preprotein translocase subunit SecG